MPFCLATDKTVLLTSKGWCAVGEIDRIIEVVGINQRGKHSTSAVRIENVHRTSQICYLGTRAAFCGFHPESRLVTANGVVREACEIARFDTPNDVEFEPAGDFSTRSIDRDILWNQLSAGAIANAADTLIYRVVSDAPPPASLRKNWVSLKRDGDFRSILIAKPGYMASVSRLGLGLIWDLLSFIYLKDNSLTFERGNYLLALWCAAYLSNTKRQYGFLYDSIQHSATLTVDLDLRTTQIERIRTAFAAQRGRVVRLRWGGHQWCPIAGGFPMIN